MVAIDQLLETARRGAIGPVATLTQRQAFFAHQGWIVVLDRQRHFVDVAPGAPTVREIYARAGDHAAAAAFSTPMLPFAVKGRPATIVFKAAVPDEPEVQAAAA